MWNFNNTVQDFTLLNLVAEISDVLRIAMLMYYTLVNFSIGIWTH
jgi:hypothetical protein